MTLTLLRAINKAILFLRLVEWKIAVDRKKIVIVLSTDLSRALDSQTYPILLCKLITYGLSTDATLFNRHNSK